MSYKNQPIVIIVTSKAHKTPTRPMTLITYSQTKSKMTNALVMMNHEVASTVNWQERSQVAISNSEASVVTVYRV